MTCEVCSHDEPHTGGGIGICLHPDCGCDGAPPLCDTVNPLAAELGGRVMDGLYLENHTPDLMQTLLTIELRFFLLRLRHEGFGIAPTHNGTIAVVPIGPPGPWI